MLKITVPCEEGMDMCIQMGFHTKSNRLNTFPSLTGLLGSQRTPASTLLSNLYINCTKRVFTIFYRNISSMKVGLGIFDLFITIFPVFNILLEISWMPNSYLTLFKTANLA